MVIITDGYYTYMLTNPNKTVLYVGITNNLAARLIEHWQQRGKQKSFAGRYYCYYLVFYEAFEYASDAIAREKEIKKWRREKKNDLINTTNPHWTFLNQSICGEWPPDSDPCRF